MVNCDIYSPGPTGRATSPALSDTSELTILSRSPSPVPDYQEVFRWNGPTLPLTPPSTPRATQATNNRSTPRNEKRSGSSDVVSSSKKLRQTREPQSPGSPTTPRSPLTPRSTRRYFENAVPSLPKPVLPTAAPWVAGKGGCGTLETLPKEVRQKIYGFAFGIDTPVTIRECCGPESTFRERGACRKHGSRVIADTGRFNILHISQSIRTEALWVVRSQAWLLLKVDKSLTQYLGCYRWNVQRRSLTTPLGSKRKTTMWASAGQFRTVEIVLPSETLMNVDPVLNTSNLVEVASSLCQSWSQMPSTNMAVSDANPKRLVNVNLGSLFQEVIPFNIDSSGGAFCAYEFSEWWCRYWLLSGSEPDFDKFAADAGHNLVRLVAVVAKYRGRSQWKFVANIELDEEDKGASKWLRTMQRECARHGMRLEHGDCDSMRRTPL